MPVGLVGVIALETLVDAATTRRLGSAAAVLAGSTLLAGTDPALLDARLLEDGFGRLQNLGPRYGLRVDIVSRTFDTETLTVVAVGEGFVASDFP